jgi:hypothetical protein
MVFLGHNINQLSVFLGAVKNPSPNAPSGLPDATGLDGNRSIRSATNGRVLH